MLATLTKVSNNSALGCDHFEVLSASNKRDHSRLFEIFKNNDEGNFA
jgi:hypothetical protein